MTSTMVVNVITYELTAAEAAVLEKMRVRRMNRRARREMWSYAGLICLVARSTSWFAYVNGRVPREGPRPDLHPS